MGWPSGVGYRLGSWEAVTHWNSFPLFLQDRVTTERTALSFALWKLPEEVTTMTGTWHCLRYGGRHSGRQVGGWQGLLRTAQLSSRLASLPVPLPALSTWQAARVWSSWPLRRTLPPEIHLQPCPCHHLQGCSPLPSLQPLTKVAASSHLFPPSLGLLPALSCALCGR